MQGFRISGRFASKRVSFVGVFGLGFRVAGFHCFESLVGLFMASDFWR